MADFASCVFQLLVKLSVRVPIHRHTGEHVCAHACGCIAQSRSPPQHGGEAAAPGAAASAAAPAPSLQDPGLPQAHFGHRVLCMQRENPADLVPNGSYGFY